MICPYCETENRDERDACYHCGKDLSMLRLIVNKAKHHYNLALEHAERGRNQEAIVELQNALDLDARHVNAHVVLGTILAREERFEEAQAEWEKALQLSPPLAKAHSYIHKANVLGKFLPALHLYRTAAIVLGVLLIATAAWFGWFATPHGSATVLSSAFDAYAEGDWDKAQSQLQRILAENEGPPQNRMLAEALSRTINESIQLRLSAAETALRAGDFATAFQDLDYLAQKDLPDELSEEVDALLRTSRDRATSQLEQAMALYRETGAGLPRVRVMLERIREARAQGHLRNIDVDALSEELTQLRRAQEADELALVRADWTETGNDSSALIRTYRLIQGTERDPESELSQFYQELLGRVRERVRERTEPLLAEGDYQAAREAEQALLDVFPRRLKGEIYGDLVPVEEKIQRVQAEQYLEALQALAQEEAYGEFLARAQEANQYQLGVTQVKDLATSVTLIQDLLAQRRLQEAQALAETGEWDQALSAIDEARQLPLMSEQVSLADDLEAETREARADDLFAQLLKLDPRFDNPPGRRVPEDVAQRVLTLWEDLSAYGPDASTYRRRQLEFYRAVSAYVLDDYELAQRLLSQFVKSYEGEYVASANEYLELAEEALAEQTPEAEETEQTEDQPE